MRKIIFMMLIFLFTLQAVFAIDITLNIQEDINVTQDNMVSEIAYSSTNQTLKKASSWLILSISAVLSILMIIKR